MENNISRLPFFSDSFQACMHIRAFGVSVGAVPDFPACFWQILRGAAESYVFFFLYLMLTQKTGGNFCSGIVVGRTG